MKSTLPQDRGFLVLVGKGLEVQIFSFLILCYDSPSAEAAQKGKESHSSYQGCQVYDFQLVDVAQQWVMC